jgi:hypothetical protein
MLIPYATDGTVYSAAAPWNTPAANFDNIVASASIAADTTTLNNYVWALFSPASSAVPEASTWALMLMGFLGIGLAVRRRPAGTLSRA